MLLPPQSTTRADTPVPARTRFRTLLDRVRHGTEFVVVVEHAVRRAAIRVVLTGAAYHRCYGHFLMNALDLFPRKADDDFLQDLRWLYDLRNLAEARADL